MAATLVLGMACGGDDDDDGGNTTPDVATQSNESTPTQAAGSTATQASGTQAANGGETIPSGAPEIDQDNLEFKPNKLTVEAGKDVFFKNSETALHTVTVNGKNESGTMKKGDVFKWTPPGPGEYKITCDFHPQMKATITVQ
ncbi:MAG: cupredoxin domain-containing protein [Hyphomicrobiales bacterium]